MEKSELKKILEVALTNDNKHARGWAFAKAIIKLGPVEELEMTRAILDADEKLREKAAEESIEDIEYEIGLRRKRTPELTSVDQALARYPRVAERAKGVGYKIALLEFSEFCSCDVNFACSLLEEVIRHFEFGAEKVEWRCGTYSDGNWPKNHLPSVLSAMAIFTQRPCWVLRHLFLPEVGRSCIRGRTIVLARE